MVLFLSLWCLLDAAIARVMEVVRREPVAQVAMVGSHLAEVAEGRVKAEVAIQVEVVAWVVMAVLATVILAEVEPVEVEREVKVERVAVERAASPLVIV